MLVIPLRLLPGLLLCLAVTAGAFGLDAAQSHLLGRTWLEPLVLAIVLGTALRTAMPAMPSCQAGIHFSAKILLEVAIVLLGCSLSAATILAVGPALLLGIGCVVAVAVSASYGIGRAVGLPRRMAMLVACGNSICGNSAIAAVAPVIGADGEEVAASIAFTAVLGVAVVLGLPALTMAIGLPKVQGGMFAGLTVYAVPQVLAAAAPLGAAAVQIGTLVKLVRVLMLGPVMLVLSVLAGRRHGGGRLSLQHVLPWFIVGFAMAIGARSMGLIPAHALPTVANAAGFLTIVSMAALGLSTDVRVVARAGGRVTAAVVLSLALLGALSLLLVMSLAK
jgi:uncharacterized integral membrane protein (TIGR00698 family)